LIRGRNICDVHKARVNFCARHVVEHLAHVFRQHELRLHLVPQFQIHERLLRVETGGHSLRIADGQLAHRRLREPVKPLRLLRRGLAAWQNKHERIAREVVARVGENQILVGEFVHLLRTGAGEDINGRGLFDLFLQDAGGREVEVDPCAGARLVELADLCEGVFETDGGRDCDLCMSG